MYLALIDRTVHFLEQFTGQHLTNTACTFATMEVRSKGLMRTLASRTRKMYYTAPCQARTRILSRRTPVSPRIPLPWREEGTRTAGAESPLTRLRVNGLRRGERCCVFFLPSWRRPVTGPIGRSARSPKLSNYVFVVQGGNTVLFFFYVDLQASRPANPWSVPCYIPGLSKCMRQPRWPSISLSHDSNGCPAMIF